MPDLDAVLAKHVAKHPEAAAYNAKVHVNNSGSRTTTYFTYKDPTSGKHLRSLKAVQECEAAKLLEHMSRAGSRERTDLHVNDDDDGASQDSDGAVLLVDPTLLSHEHARGPSRTRTTPAAEPMTDMPELRRRLPPSPSVSPSISHEAPLALRASCCTIRHPYTAEGPDALRIAIKALSIELNCRAVDPTGRTTFTQFINDLGNVDLDKTLIGFVGLASLWRDDKFWPSTIVKYEEPVGVGEAAQWYLVCEYSSTVIKPTPVVDKFELLGIDEAYFWPIAYDVDARDKMLKVQTSSSLRKNRYAYIAAKSRRSVPGSVDATTAIRRLQDTASLLAATSSTDSAAPTSDAARQDRTSSAGTSSRVSVDRWSTSDDDNDLSLSRGPDTQPAMIPPNDKLATQAATLHASSPSLSLTSEDPRCASSHRSAPPSRRQPSPLARYFVPIAPPVTTVHEAVEDNDMDEVHELASQAGSWTASSAHRRTPSDVPRLALSRGSAPRSSRFPSALAAVIEDDEDPDMAEFGALANEGRPSRTSSAQQRPPSRVPHHARSRASATPSQHQPSNVTLVQGQPSWNTRLRADQYSTAPHLLVDSRKSHSIVKESARRQLGAGLGTSGLLSLVIDEDTVTALVESFRDMLERNADLPTLLVANKRPPSNKRTKVIIEDYHESDNTDERSPPESTRSLDSIAPHLPSSLGVVWREWASARPCLLLGGRSKGALQLHRDAYDQFFLKMQCLAFQVPIHDAHVIEPNFLTIVAEPTSTVEGYLRTAAPTTFARFERRVPSWLRQRLLADVERHMRYLPEWLEWSAKLLWTHWPPKMTKLHRILYPCTAPPAGGRQQLAHIASRLAARRAEPGPAVLPKLLRYPRDDGEFRRAPQPLPTERILLARKGSEGTVEETHVAASPRGRLTVAPFRDATHAAPNNGRIGKPGCTSVPKPIPLVAIDLGNRAVPSAGAHPRFHILLAPCPSPLYFIDPARDVPTAIDLREVATLRQLHDLGSCLVDACKLSDATATNLLDALRTNARLAVNGLVLGKALRTCDVTALTAEPVHRIMSLNVDRFDMRTPYLASARNLLSDWQQKVESMPQSAAAKQIARHNVSVEAARWSTPEGVLTVVLRAMFLFDFAEFYVMAMRVLGDRTRAHKDFGDWLAQVIDVNDRAAKAIFDAEELETRRRILRPRPMSVSEFDRKQRHAAMACLDFHPDASGLYGELRSALAPESIFSSMTVNISGEAFLPDGASTAETIPFVQVAANATANDASPAAVSAVLSVSTPMQSSELLEETALPQMDHPLGDYHPYESKQRVELQAAGMTGARGGYTYVKRYLVGASERADTLWEQQGLGVVEARAALSTERIKRQMAEEQADHFAKEATAKASTKAAAKATKAAAPSTATTSTGQVAAAVKPGMPTAPKMTATAGKKAASKAELPKETTTSSVDDTRKAANARERTEARTLLRRQAVNTRYQLALQQDDAHPKGQKNDALLIELMVNGLVFSCFSYLRGGPPQALDTVRLNNYLLALDVEQVDTFDARARLRACWSTTLSEERARAARALVGGLMVPLLNTQQVVAMLSDGHPILEQLQQGEVATVGAALGEYGSGAKSNLPIPGVGFVTSGRWHPMGYEQMAAMPIRKLAASQALPHGDNATVRRSLLAQQTGEPSNDELNAELPPNGETHWLKGWGSDFMPMVVMRALHTEGLLSEPLRVMSGGPGTEAIAKRFGYNTSAELLAMLRTVDWAIQVTPVIADWLHAYPEDAQHKDLVQRLAGRQHRDCDLENFGCETLKHVRVFGGGGTNRSYTSPNRRNYALLVKVARAALEV